MLLTLYWVTGWLQWLFSLWLPLFWCRVTPFENKEPYARSALLLYSLCLALASMTPAHIEDKILTRTHVRALCTHTHSYSRREQAQKCEYVFPPFRTLCARLQSCQGYQHFPQHGALLSSERGGQVLIAENGSFGGLDFVFLFLFRARGANFVSRQTFLTVAFLNMNGCRNYHMTIVC
jgi:hypothetical protein